MPFWHGDAAGPAARARARHRQARARAAPTTPRPAARERLLRRARPRRARRRATCSSYLDDQAQATGAVPERPDDRRRALPGRARRLARLRALAASAPGATRRGRWRRGRARRERLGADVERSGRRRHRLPAPGDRRRRPTSSLPPPRADEVEDLVVGELGAIVALRRAVPRGGRPRAAPAAAPPRRSARRSGQQRKRAADLLAVASRFRLVPDAARDVPRVPARRVRPAGAGRDPARRRARARCASSPSTRARPSPFAASLLFAFVANFIYDGDAPLAERRAQALAIDQAQLRELLGEAELRELLDADAIAELEAQLQHLVAGSARAERRRRSPISSCASATSRREEIARARGDAAEVAAEPSTRSSRERRVVPRPRSAGEERFVAVEDAARYRDALGVAAPAGRARGVPRARRRGARGARRRATRAGTRRSPPSDSAARFGLASRAGGGARSAGSPQRGRVLEGAFRPRGRGARVVRSGGAARAAAPVAREAARRDRAGGAARVRPAPRRAGTASRAAAAGLDAVLDAVEKLQGRAAPRLAARDRDPAGARRGLPARRPRHARRRRARCCGWAWSRSASATGGSRSTSPTRSRGCSRPRPPRRRGRCTGERGEAPRRPGPARRLLLRRAARGARRRVRAAHARRALGRSCGRGSSRTTPSRRCAPTRSQRRSGRSDAGSGTSPTARPTARAWLFRPPPAGDGHSSLRGAIGRAGAPQPDRVERRRRRSSSSHATGSCRAARPPRSRSPAASAPCTRCCVTSRRAAASAAATSWPAWGRSSSRSRACSISSGRCAIRPRCPRW